MCMLMQSPCSDTNRHAVLEIFESIENEGIYAHATIVHRGKGHGDQNPTFLPRTEAEDDARMTAVATIHESGAMLFLLATSLGAVVCNMKFSDFEIGPIPDRRHCPCMMALCGLALLALVEVAWARLPAPLPYVCQMTEELGCFNDSWSRTFPVSVSEGVHGHAKHIPCCTRDHAYACARRHLTLPDH